MLFILLFVCVHDRKHVPCPKRFPSNTQPGPCLRVAQVHGGSWGWKHGQFHVIQSHTIHGTGILPTFLVVFNGKNMVFMYVNRPVPWMLWEYVTWSLKRRISKTGEIAPGNVLIFSGVHVVLGVLYSASLRIIGPSKAWRHFEHQNTPAIGSNNSIGGSLVILRVSSYMGIARSH